MPAHHSEPPPARLSSLFSAVRQLATGRELQIDDAVNYFGDPKRLASVEEDSGVLDDPAKRQVLEMLLSEQCNGL